LRDQFWGPSNILPINIGLQHTHKWRGQFCKKGETTKNPKNLTLSPHSPKLPHKATPCKKKNPSPSTEPLPPGLLSPLHSSSPNYSPHSLLPLTAPPPGLNISPLTAEHRTSPQHSQDNRFTTISHAGQAPPPAARFRPTVIVPHSSSGSVLSSYSIAVIVSQLLHPKLPPQQPLLWRFPQ